MLKIKHYNSQSIPSLFPIYSQNNEQVVIFIHDSFELYSRFFPDSFKVNSQFIPCLFNALDNGRVLQFPVTPKKYNCAENIAIVSPLPTVPRTER